MTWIPRPDWTLDPRKIHRLFGTDKEISIYSDNRARVLRAEPEEIEGLPRFGWEFWLKRDLRKGDLILGTTS